MFQNVSHNNIEETQQLMASEYTAIKMLFICLQLLAVESRCS